ncbi:MAG: BRO family protein [Parasphingorhabdus sp.]
MSAVALRNFGFEEQLVRVIERSDDPWFIAGDVAKVLGYRNASDMTRNLEEDEQHTHNVRMLEGSRYVDRPVKIISESGLYAAVFKSRLESAIRFRKWVTSEVLPTLRKEGVYQMPVANDPADEHPLSFLQTGEDIERFRTAVSAIRECRIVKGKKEARRLWNYLGLPEPPKICSNGVPDMAHIRFEDIAAWAQERLVFEDGARTSAAELRDDYENWCNAHGVKPKTRIAFGKSLSDFGFDAFHSNGSWRRDCRLKD